MAGQRGAPQLESSAADCLCKPCSPMGVEPSAFVDGGSDSPALAEPWVFRRCRPCHAARFLAFARETFGPLLQDQIDSSLAGVPRIGRRVPTEPAAPVRGAGLEDADSDVVDADFIGHPFGTPWQEAIRQGEGCLWFAGSDDLAGDWRFKAAAPDGEAQHLLRCGAAWYTAEGAAEEGTDVGSRRTELMFWLAGPHAGAARAALTIGLGACLLTREEAVEAERTGRVPGLEEWEQTRLDHAHLTQWANRLAPFLSVVHGMASFVSAVPGVERVGGIANGIANGLMRRMGTGQCPTG